MVAEVRARLDVSAVLAAVAATLIGVVVPGVPVAVDSLNDPTTQPIPGGLTQVGRHREEFKTWIDPQIGNRLI